MHGHVTAGWVVGLTIAIVLTLIVVCCAITVLYGMESLGLSAIALVGGLVLVWGVWLIASWPLRYEYHHWVEVQGRVTQIGNRFIPDGDHGVSQRFVVAVNGTQYGVDDTRAALVKVGDPIKLRCKKEHQFFQPYDSDGWACRWGGVTA